MLSTVAVDGGAALVWRRISGGKVLGTIGCRLGCGTWSRSAASCSASCTCWKRGWRPASCRCAAPECCGVVSQRGSGPCDWPNCDSTTAMRECFKGFAPVPFGPGEVWDLGQRVDRPGCHTEECGSSQKYRQVGFAFISSKHFSYVRGGAVWHFQPLETGVWYITVQCRRQSCNRSWPWRQERQVWPAALR